MGADPREKIKQCKLDKEGTTKHEDLLYTRRFQRLGFFCISVDLLPKIFLQIIFPNRISTVAVGCFLVIGCCSFARAGGEPGEFLQWGAGARSLGMGRAFLAVSDDASATYWNPAAMVQLERKELMGLQAQLAGETNFTFLSYVSPSSKSSAWGFNMTTLASAGFEKVTATLDPSAPPSSRAPPI